METRDHRLFCRSCKEKSTNYFVLVPKRGRRCSLSELKLVHDSLGSTVTVMKGWEKTIFFFTDALNDFESVRWIKSTV